MAIKPPRSRMDAAQVRLPLHSSKEPSPKSPEPWSATSDAFRRLLDRIWWAKGMRAVAMGCGSGESALALHSRLRAELTIGLDEDPNQIHRAAALQSQSLRFQAVDPLKWTSSDSFDVALVQPPSGEQDTVWAFLSQARSLLQAEGQLVLHLPLVQDQTISQELISWSRDSLFSEFLSKPKSTPSVSPLALSSELHRVGFRAQQVDVQVIPQPLKNPAELLDWMCEFILPPWREGTSEETIDQFQAQALAKLQTAQTDRLPIFWPTAHLLAWARLP